MTPAFFFFFDVNLYVILCMSSFSFQKNSKSKELFEQVLYSLDIVEKDYFGLSFMDAMQVQVRDKVDHRLLFDNKQ